MRKKITYIIIFGLLLSNLFIVIPSDKVCAESYNGQDLALAIIANSSWLIDSSYTDTDTSGYDQSIVLSSHGIMTPTDGPTFALFSTGVAGVDIITTDENEPGDERGSWFEGGKFGYPRDSATLQMTLQVPMYMHYLYYDVQFFSAEYPEYVGTQYNDKLTITVESPSEGTSEYFFDVNSGYFVLDSHDITGTGFDIFAQSGYPNGVDWIDTTPRNPGADAGASDLITIGGETHPVSPNEQINVTIDITDSGDNLFDSGAFIDNLFFSGYAKATISAYKKAYDDEGNRITGPIESSDKVKYIITITNTGTSDQDNNPGNEFEDILPGNTTYVNGSAFSEYGTVSYLAGENKIIWNGNIPSESSRIIEYEVTINEGLNNGTIIPNQGTVYWDSNENGTNNAIEYTDDPYIDDGYDLDGDGETNDDDSTNLTAITFVPPSSVIEDFSDDAVGDGAKQSYLTRDWFETTEGRVGNTFEVVSSFEYQTDNSFKAKLRQSGSPQYWNYTLSELERNLQYWEVWFACGDGSEEYDLTLDFKTSAGQDIARIKFEYVELEIDHPLRWLLTLSYWDPGLYDWKQLNSDFDGGYLRNSWYKIRLEKNGVNNINYSLYRSGKGLVDQSISSKLAGSFNDFQSVVWQSNFESVVCSMFFWDDHKIGLS